MYIMSTCEQFTMELNPISWRTLSVQRLLVSPKLPHSQRTCEHVEQEYVTVSVRSHRVANSRCKLHICVCMETGEAHLFAK